MLIKFWLSMVQPIDSNSNRCSFNNNYEAPAAAEETAEEVTETTT